MSLITAEFRNFVNILDQGKKIVQVYITMQVTVFVY